MIRNKLQLTLNVFAYFNDIILKFGLDITFMPQKNKKLTRAIVLKSQSILHDLKTKLQALVMLPYDHCTYMYMCYLMTKVYFYIFS